MKMTKMMMLACNQVTLDHKAIRSSLRIERLFFTVGWLVLLQDCFATLALLHMSLCICT